MKDSPFILILIISDFFGIFFASLLFGYHTNLIIKSKTTNEDIKR